MCRGFGRTLLLVLVMASATARAQTDPSGVATAESAFAEGRFEEARELLNRLADGDGLETVEQVRELLILRVRVSVALRDEDATERDLRRLAALAPRRALPESVPPGVRERFEEIATLVEPLDLEVTHEEVFGGVVVRARASEGASDLARGVRVHARTPGGEWLSSDDEVMRVAAPPGTAVEYYASLVGPGGAVLASAASPQRPRRARSLGRADLGDAGRPAAADPEPDASDPWPAILGVGVPLVVVVGVAVGLGVHFGSQAGDGAIEVAPPMIRW
jgi:hypothetical protein